MGENHMITISAPASVSKITTMADRTMRLQMDISRELPPEEMAALFEMRNTEGFFAYKQGKFADEELLALPDYTPEFKNDKSPSQRLRGVLYVVWQDGGSIGSFENFYLEQMDKIITHYKSKLP